MTKENENTPSSEENEMATDEHYFYECSCCGADYTKPPPHCFNCGESPFWRGPFNSETGAR